MKEDLRAQLDALSLAAGGYPVGEFQRGFLAALSAVRVSIGLPPADEHWHEPREWRLLR